MDGKVAVATVPVVCAPISMTTSNRKRTLESVAHFDEMMDRSRVMGVCIAQSAAFLRRRALSR
jgi:hypothetical protein